MQLTQFWAALLVIASSIFVFFISRPDKTGGTRTGVVLSFLTPVLLFSYNLWLYNVTGRGLLEHLACVPRHGTSGCPKRETSEDFFPGISKTLPSIFALVETLHERFGSAQTLYDRAIIHEGKGEYSLAIADLNQVIGLNQNIPRAYFYRGRAYDETNERALAIADYDKSILLEPKLAEAYFYRGYAYLYNGAWNHAIRDFNKAISIKPNFSDAFFGRAEANYNLSNLDQAIRDYSSAIRFGPSTADAFLYGGGVYFEVTGRNREIHDEIVQWDRIKPSLADAFYDRALAFFDEGNFEQAIKDCSEAIKRKDKFFLAYYYRGLAYQKDGELELAVQDFTDALRVRPNDILSLETRGLARQKLGDIVGSEEDKARAKKLRATNYIMPYSQIH